MIQPFKDSLLRLRDSLLSGDRLNSKRNIFKNVKQIAFFGVNKPLQGSHLDFTVSGFAQFFQQGFPGDRVRPDDTKLILTSL